MLVDACEPRSTEGGTHMFLAHPPRNEFHLTVLTDNGVAFTNRAATTWDCRVHVFDRVCRARGVAHARTRL